MRVCESFLELKSSQAVGGGRCADVNEQVHRYFKEDRWGSCECTLCGVRLKNETAFRAHVHTALHQENYAKALRLEGKTENADDADDVDELKKITFFVDPYAHHSTSLPFRELARRYQEQVKVVEFKCHDDRPILDGELFEKALLSAVDNSKSCVEKIVGDSAGFNSNHERIAVLSAASNVTGEKRDVASLTQKLHQRGVKAAWDFAAL